MAVFNPREAAELQKSRASVVRFARKHMHIEHPVKGTTQLEPHGFQEDVLRTFDANRRVALLGARQMGWSTMIATYALWRATFNPGETILVCMPKDSSATEFMRIVNRAYEKLPEYLRVPLKELNKPNVTFANDSKIITKAISPYATRGLAVSLMVVLDFAYVRPDAAREFWTAVQPTFTLGRCILASARGSYEQHLFMDIWKNAGTNGFRSLYRPWYVHPERDDTWAATWKSQIGADAFAQEYDCVIGK